jgi:indole-3-glycerol phosphate synthase
MILDTIVERKQEEVQALKRTGIRPPDTEVDGPRGFMRALTDWPGVAIIAEAKKASPSRGVIAPDFDPVRIARGYAEGGAQAMSVLTDRDFFQGDLSYLVQVRRAVDLPVLRKDFMVDSLQIDEARAFGADAILLIAAILSEKQMRDFRQQAEELGMDVLVEVHNEEETEAALASGARLIGVNNRNLRDFSVDLGTTFRLQNLVPKDIPLVSESGISRTGDIEQLRDHGICAALIGESLMRSGVQGTLLVDFLAAGRLPG